MELIMHSGMALGLALALTMTKSMGLECLA